MTVYDMAARPANEPYTKMTRGESVRRVGVSLEVALYALLLVLAFALRFASLGAAPLNDAEAREALAALRAVNDQTPGAPIVSTSPLTYLLQAAIFGVFPASEALARLPLALAGLALTFAPLLWRRYLGPLSALVISLLLTISPVVLLASRTSSLVLWTMLLALIGPWLVLRFIETRAQSWAIAAAVAFGAMILLAEPAGYITFLALAFGVGFAWLTEADPDADIRGAAGRLWRGWPWTRGLIALGVAVFVVGTGLFVLPTDLTAVGNLLWTGFRNLGDRRDGAPPAFPLLVALRYETGIVLFGLIACYRAIRVGGFFERVLVGWFLAGLIWSLLYAGATAGHALWLTLPLIVLVGLMVTRWLTEQPGVTWRVPEWAVPVHALVTCMLWFVVGVGLVIVGKVLVVHLPYGITDWRGLLELLTSAVYQREAANVELVSLQGIQFQARLLGDIQQSLSIAVLMTLFNAVLFFLVGSIWGARTAWRGFALGSLVYLLLVGLSAGGQAAFNHPTDARELWTVNPVTDDVRELRATLREMSLRDTTLEGTISFGTGTPNLIAITAWVPDDGALAWALRDFPNTTFVDGVGPEVKTAAVVMPQMAEQPVLGGEYVGKDLVIREAWNLDTLSWRDMLLWLYRGETVIKPVPGETCRLWIRKDIYGVERVTED